MRSTPSGSSTRSEPGNVMLGHYGEVYLLDWGLAKVQGEAPSLDEIEALDGVEMSPAAQTRQGALLGTPGYMSPEQVDGKHDELGPPSDVYGLGALLFELLTLRPLHEGANMAQLIASTRDGADARTSVRAPERNVPPEIEAICIRATALDPKDRHRTARELHDDIDAFLGGERDLELRRQMAAAHAENAVEAAQNARGGSSEIQGRRTAMQELGRALALDPENQDAMTTLMALLSEPPSELPREVSAELEHSIRSQNRKTALNGAWVYGTLIAYLPLLVWSGIREPAWIVAFFSLAFVCGGLSIWTLRTRPTTPMIMIVMAISTFMFAMLTPLVGPLVLVPTLLVANAVAFICHLDRRNRVITMAWTSLAVLLPFGLELVGVVDPSYLFSEAGMLVTARAADLESAPTLLLLLVSSIAALITCGMSVSRTRDNLREAEKRLYLYAWHLREFVPGAIRSATDPTGARRSLLSIPR